MRLLFGFRKHKERNEKLIGIETNKSAWHLSGLAVKF